MKTLIAAALLLAGALPAWGFSDAVDGRYFDPATSAEEGGTLNIGLHSGVSPVTWTPRDFLAGGSSNRKAASDSISVDLAGCPTSAVAVVSGVASVAGNGAVVASVTLSGGDKPAVVEFVRASVGQGAFTRSVSIEAECLTKVNLSVALFAHSTPSGNPSIRVTSAVIELQ